MLQGMRTVALSALSLGFLCACASGAAVMSCGECCTLQEVIARSIVTNISALEKSAIAGSSSTATVEIGQIIWKVCGSDAWKEARLQESFDTACKAAIAEHTDLMTKCAHHLFFFGGNRT